MATSLIRRATPNDIHLLYAWRINPDVAKYMLTPGPKSFEEHEEWLTSIFADDSKELCIISVSDRPVGVLTAVRELGHAEVGIYIGDTNLRGSGVGPIALSTFTDILFKDPNTHHLTASIFAWNNPSISTFKKAGFTEIDYKSDIGLKYFQKNA